MSVQIVQERTGYDVSHPVVRPAGKDHGAARQGVENSDPGAEDSVGRRSVLLISRDLSVPHHCRPAPARRQGDHDDGHAGDTARHAGDAAIYTGDAAGDAARHAGDPQLTTVVSHS